MPFLTDLSIFLSGCFFGAMLMHLFAARRPAPKRDALGRFVKKSR